MGIGNRYGNNCDSETVAIANKYLGTSYDTIKAVFDHLDKINTVAELGELERGLQGNTPDVTDNGDGTYTLTGNNGTIIISDGFSPAVKPNGLGNGVDIVDYYGGVTSIINGLGVVVLPVYVNSNTKPVTPTTGSYDGSVLIPPSGFTLGAESPIASEATWVTHATFREQADTTWTVSEWSEPARHSGYTPQKGIDYVDGETGAYTTYIYRNFIGIPPTPSGGAYDGTSETFPSGWTDVPSEVTSTQQIWFSVARYNYDIDTDTWVSTGWHTPREQSGRVGYTPQKGVDYFDGTAGQQHIYVYQNATNPPPPPNNGSYDGTVSIPPTNWTNAPTTPNTNEAVWVTHVVYTPDDNGDWIRGTWSIPGQLSGYTPVKGLDYDDGTDGRHISWIYTTQSTVPNVPVGGSFNGTSEDIPVGWADDPTTPADSSEVVYQSTRTYTHDGTNYTASGNWSLPVAISGVNGYTPVFGVDYFNGLTGNFRSSIFKMAATLPVVPVGGAFDGTDEIPPLGWLDNPVTPVGGQAIWISQTIYSVDNSGVWTHVGWSEPIQFNGKDGRAFYESTIYINSVGAPTKPLDAEGSYDGTTEIYPTGWSNEIVATTDDEATYMSKTTYTIADDDTWSHTPWNLPILFIDSKSIAESVTELEGDIDTILEDVIWNTVHNHETVTTSAYNVASIRDTNITITTETSARVLQGTELTAAVDTEKGRIDSTITKLNSVEADADGNAVAITALEGTVNNGVTGVSATYTIASSAKTQSNGNASSITNLSNSVSSLNGDVNSLNTATASLTLQANNNVDAINGLTARAALQVDVNGRVSGIFIEGSQVANSITLQADEVSFVTPTGVPKLYWSGSELIFNGSGTFSGDISAASGTFSGSIYAANIEGDVVDVAVKNTAYKLWNNSAGTHTLSTINIAPATFARTLLVSSVFIAGGTIGSFTLQLKDGGSIVDSTLAIGYQDSVQVISRPLVTTIPADTAKVYTLTIGAVFSGNAICEVQPLIIQVFKNGSTIS